MNLHSPGSLIANHYEVASHPLLGGMGIVYLCIDRNTDQPVALKTFKPEYLSNRDARDIFLKEGTTWVALGKNPHIVQCYGVEHIADGREIYLVLELVAKAEGRKDASLRSWLTPGQPLPIEKALLFALQIVRGMHYACTSLPGFVHCDLKPENLLVGADPLLNSSFPRLRVTDFGLAKVLNQSSLLKKNWEIAYLSHTRLMHGIAGTPHYMAPEQWQGASISAQTDIFALGAILFEMLSGEHAVPGTTVEELNSNCSRGKFSSIPNTLPVQLKSFIANCLELQVRNRPESWDQMEELLSKYITDLTGQSAPQRIEQNQLDRSEIIRLGWAFSSIGTSYLDIGLYKDSERCFTNMYAIGEKENAADLISASLGNLGIVCQSQGDYQRAIHFHEESLPVFRQIGNQIGEGKALSGLGAAYSSLGQYVRAIQHYEASLNIFQQAENRIGEGSVLCSLGSTYSSIGDYTSAIHYYEKTLMLARQLGDLQGEAAALGNLGVAYYSLGEYIRAINYYEQVLTITQRISDQHGEGIALGNIGNTYNSLGEYNRAIQYHEQHLSISKLIGDKRGEGDALGNLGNVYHNLGEYNKAIQYHEQSLAIAYKIGNRLGEGNELCNLGNSYLCLGENSRAIEYYEQSLIITRQTGDRHGEGNALGNLASAYGNYGDFSKAIHYLEQHLAIARQIGDRQGEINALGNLGNVYFRLGNFPRAIQNYELSLSTARQIKDQNGVARAYFNLAACFGQQGQIERALPIAQEAVKLFEQIRSPNTDQARDLLALLLSGSTSPNLADILREFAALINTVVDATKGNPSARKALEDFLPKLEQNGWYIANPIYRIWAGERDEKKLTQGLDESETIIIREILINLK